jgi:hypothetical protein
MEGSDGNLDGEGDKEIVPTPKGYKNVSIEQESKFLDALQEHATSCQCKMNHLANLHKWGFEVQDLYQCTRCKQTIIY